MVSNIESYYIHSIFVFIFGAILGSFFNVVIWRLPRGESVIKPSSYCPSCKTPIKIYLNIPLLGYLLCLGKCAKCKQKISPVYPLIELTTAFASVILWLQFVSTAQSITIPNSIMLIMQFLWLLSLIPMSVIDFKHFIIPDIFTLPLIISGLAGSFLPAGITPLDSLLGILAGGGSLYTIGWIGTILLKKGDVMGGGDIKLMAASGAIFGWQLAIISIILGAFLGSFTGIALLVVKKLNVDHKIPFGPFLGLGIWLSFLWGDKILSWYLSFIT